MARASVLDALPRYEFEETGVGCADHGDPTCLCDVVITTPVHATYGADEIMFGRTIARRMDLAYPLSAAQLTEWAERTLGLYDEAKGWAAALNHNEGDELDTWVLDAQYAADRDGQKRRTRNKKLADPEEWARTQDQFKREWVGEERRREDWELGRYGRAQLPPPKASVEQYEAWRVLLVDMPPTEAARRVGMPVAMLARRAGVNNILRRLSPCEMDEIWRDLADGHMTHGALVRKWGADGRSMYTLRAVFGFPQPLTTQANREWLDLCVEVGVAEACRRYGRPLHAILAYGFRALVHLDEDQLQFCIDAIKEGLTWSHVRDLCPIAETSFGKMRNRYYKGRAV